MRQNQKAILLVAIEALVVLLVAGFVIWFFFLRSSSPTPETPDENNPNILTPIPTTVRTTEVTYTGESFEPETITVKVNETVTFRNESGESGAVVSDPPSAHPILNLGEFADGSSLQAPLTQIGTYNYYNNFKPEAKGTIIVEP